MATHDVFVSMIWKRATVVLLVLPALINRCSADNLQRHLVGVQRSTVTFPIAVRVTEVHGSGICIDPNCSIVATAYHTQLLAGGKHLNVASIGTKKVLSPPQDSDSTQTTLSTNKKTVRYNPEHDISFIYTKKPVPQKSGISYSYECYAGQKVEVAGYVNHKFTRRTAQIIGVNMRLLVGESELEENLVLDVGVPPGASGSAVLDESGRLLGMVTLSGTIKSARGDSPVSVALPVTTIATALLRLDSAQGTAIFHDVPPLRPSREQDSFVPFQESDVPEDTSEVIPELPAIPLDVPDAVAQLQKKSSDASRLMVNVLARQCLVQGTQPPVCHELSVVKGEQTFRSIKKNGQLGKPKDSFPLLRHGVWITTDWLELLREISDKPWVFRGTVGNAYLFNFQSNGEQDGCDFDEYPQGVPLTNGANWTGSVSCTEHVLTDRDFNVISVFVEMFPPDGCVTQGIQRAIHYDWIKLPGWKQPVLLPVKERITAKVQGQKNLWYTQVSWTDYRLFTTEHKIRF